MYLCIYVLTTKTENWNTITIYVSHVHVTIRSIICIRIIKTGSWNEPAMWSVPDHEECGCEFRKGNEKKVTQALGYFASAALLLYYWTILLTGKVIDSQFSISAARGLRYSLQWSNASLTMRVVCNSKIQQTAWRWYKYLRGLEKFEILKKSFFFFSLNNIMQLFEEDVSLHSQLKVRVWENFVYFLKRQKYLKNQPFRRCWEHWFYILIIPESF